MRYQTLPVLVRALIASSIAGLVTAPLVRAQPVEPSEGGDPAPEVRPALEPPAEPVVGSSESEPVDAGLRAKLRLTIDAYSQAKSLSFRSKVSYTGFLDGKSPATEATVRMTRPADQPSAWVIRANGTGKRKSDDSPVDFDAVWGPTSISWLDAPAKKLFDRPAGQGRGAFVQMAAGSVPTQITERTPFSRESVAEKMTLDAADPIGGVPCELLTIRAKAKHGTIKLWIGSDDHLVRRVERVSESAAYGSSTIIEITDLKLDEGITPESLAIQLPDGYVHDRTLPAKPAVSETVLPIPATIDSDSAPPRGISPGTSTRVRPNPRTAATPGEPGTAGPEDPPATTSTPLATSGREDEGALGVGLSALPPFSALAADGTTVDAQSLRGRASLLFFFGSWSLASRAAEPGIFKTLDEVTAAGPGGTGAEAVKIYAFAVRERSKDGAKEFGTLASRGATLVPSGDEAARAFGVRIYPTLILVDPQGRVATRVEGYRRDTTPGETMRALRSLLGLAPLDPPPAHGGVTPE